MLQTTSHLRAGAAALRLAAALAVAGQSAPSLAQTGGTARVRTRSYFFAEAGRNSEYKLFVSSRYREGVPAPLLVALHPFATPPERILLYQGLLDLAEERGYVAVAPTGFDTRAWYAAEGSAPGSGAELSERDVLNVVAAVRTQYTIDPGRIYLMGHSMGGGGAWQLGIRHPDVWAALAPVAPAIAAEPDALGAIARIPVIVIHGTADETVDVAGTRRVVERMKELGMRYEYVEVPGGDHTAIISRSPENMRKIFDFFDGASSAR